MAFFYFQYISSAIFQIYQIRIMKFLKNKFDLDDFKKAKSQEEKKRKKTRYIIKNILINKYMTIYQILIFYLISVILISAMDIQ